MSEANREIARRYTAAIDERRVPEELLAPEFTIENVETAVTDRTYRGAEGVREWIEDFFGVLGEDARYESETIAAGEDFVVGDIRIVGKGSASGVPLDLHHYGVLWIRDGRITRAVGYPTRRDALRAVGLDEPPRVPFTLRNLRADVEDVGGNFDGAPDLEFRLATRALGLERSGLGLQRIPPGYRFPYGHTHRAQEEVYVVVGGSGRMKLDDEIVEVGKWDVVRVPPGTWRGYEAGPEGLEMLVFGAPGLGEDPRADVEGRRDWWAG